MSHTMLPIHIKPHLIPFMFKKLKCVEYFENGVKLKAVKVTTHTAIGKLIRLLVEKTNKMVVCDKTPQIILKLEDQPKTRGVMAQAYQYEDIRSSFCCLPEAGVELLNEYLEDQLQIALMHFINSWHLKKGHEGIDIAIILFLENYNLEEYGYTVTNIRRDYYRKKSAGFFESLVQFDPLGYKVV